MSIVLKCCVENCEKLSTENGIIFHRFPKLEHIRKQWIEKCNLTKKITSKTFVCSTHFKDEDYFPSRKPKRLLKRIAIPSQRLGKPKFIPNIILKKVQQNSSSCSSTKRRVALSSINKNISDHEVQDVELIGSKDSEISELQNEQTDSED